MNVIRGGEVHAVDDVDYISEEIAGEHPVEGLLEHGGEDIAGIPLSAALQAS